MKQSRLGMVWIRLLTGIALAGVMLLLIWIPHLHGALTIFSAGLAAIGLCEYFAIVRARGVDPETPGGVLAGTAVVLSGYNAGPEQMSAVLSLAVIFVAALHLFRRRHTLAGTAASVLGVVYVGWFAAHVVALHAIPGAGPGLVTLLLMAVVWSDTGAYFAGSSLGRHKLAPKVSPNKTWEGAVGGIAAAMASTAFLYGLQRGLACRGLPDWSLAAYLWMGAALALVSQIGDLVESMLKRDAGIKDSGGIFPGHGGVLDRCDGILFAAPVFYYMILFGTR